MPEFLDIPEMPDPQQSFFQRSEKPLNAAVALRLSDERRRRRHAGTLQLLAEVRAQYM